MRDLPGLAVHVTACLAGVLLLAAGCRALAVRMRQPAVIGEVAGGLLVGPLLLGAFGRSGLDTVLSPPVVGTLKLLGEAGLALYLVRIGHEMRSRPSGPSRRSVAFAVAGSLLPCLLAGAALAGWIVLDGDPAVRGTAPLPAFVLFVALATSVTAVPVLVRVLADRGMETLPVGRLSLAAAIVLDGIGWVLLAVVLAVGGADAAPPWLVAGTVVLAVVAVRALRVPLRSARRANARARAPVVAAVLVGAGAVAAAFAAERAGLSAIVGAVLVSFAVPLTGEREWEPVVRRVGAVGLCVVPVFFVVTGVTVLTTATASTGWLLVVLTFVAGAVSKVGGGYVGGRLGRIGRAESLHLGLLMNTRGLTELVFLQAGYGAGVLTAPVYAAFLVMALATTALTGPLLTLSDRGRDHRQRARRTSRRSAADSTASRV